MSEDNKLKTQTNFSKKKYEKYGLKTFQSYRSGR